MLAPLLLHNALTWGTSSASLNSVSRRTYAFGLPEDATDYADRVGLHIHETLRSFAAVFNPPEQLSDYMFSVLAVYVVLLTVSVLYLLRKGNSLPALMFVLTPILLAIVDKRAKFPNDSRYFAYLLPVGYLAIGILTDAALRALWRWTPPEGWWNRVRWQLGKLPEISLVSAGRVLVTAFLLVNLVRLALYPLYMLIGVNNFFLHYNFTANPILALAQRAREADAPRVLVDEDLYGAHYWMCNGATAGEALSYILELNSVPNAVTSFQDTVPAVGEWVAVTPERAVELATTFALAENGSTPPSSVHCAPETILLYRVQGTPAQ
jgi:hypothetical protein